MTTRRSFLAGNLIGAAGLAANPARLFSATTAARTTAESHPADGIPPLVRSDRNFWKDWPAWLTTEMNEARNRRLQTLAELQSVTQLKARAAKVRTQLWDLLGGEPEKTPLHAKVTGTLELDQFRIEKIVYESFPQVYVTANLYIPRSGKPPYPAILAPVGHSDNGKEYSYYQHLYQNLARKGYVVLAYDPFGQGERLQYINPKTGRSLYGPTGEHSEAGRPMVLFGATLALYFAWDGIRGVDYLLTRPEVDPTRIGCTGNSGGGTMTMYMAALEPRLAAAAVSDGNTENIAGPFFDPPGATDDAEQNIVGSLPFGIDRGDLLLTFAPKPLLICYTTHDEGVTYSPVYEESTQHIYEELQRAYRIHGVEERVGLYGSHLPHSLNFFNRTQIYAWFNRWLGHPNATDSDEPLEIIPGKELNATPTGQVSTSFGDRSVIQLNTDYAAAAKQKSAFRDATMDSPATRKKQRERLHEILALPGKRTSIQSRVRSVNRRRNIVIDEIQFDSEPGLRIPGWFLAPASGKKRRPTVLYLNDDGGHDAVAEPGSLTHLVDAGYAVCAISLRGLDISLPRFPSGGPLYYEGGSVPLAERFAWTSLVLGKPVIGQRVWDALRAVDYLHTRPDVDPSQIRILGVEGPGIAALMAGFLDHRIRSVCVNRTLASYTSIVESKAYSLQLSWFTPRILCNFDLPDIAVGLSPRSCWIMNPVDANGNVLSEPSLKDPYEHRMGKPAPLPATLKVFVDPAPDPQESYLEWLRKT